MSRKGLKILVSFTNALKDRWSGSDNDTRLSNFFDTAVDKSFDDLLKEISNNPFSYEVYEVDDIYNDHSKCKRIYYQYVTGTKVETSNGTFNIEDRPYINKLQKQNGGKEMAQESTLTQVMNNPRVRSEVSVATKAIANVAARKIATSLEDALLAIVAAIYPDKVESYAKVIKTEFGKFAILQVLPELLRLAPESVRKHHLIQLFSASCKEQSYEIIGKLILTHGATMASQAASLLTMAVKAVPGIAKEEKFKEVQKRVEEVKVVPNPVVELLKPVEEIVEQEVPQEPQFLVT